MGFGSSSFKAGITFLAKSRMLLSATSIGMLPYLKRRAWGAWNEDRKGKSTRLSYDDIARAIARPSAARAVGNALRASPIARLIPCHRVIHNTGELGGYRWGEARKRAMLARESLRPETI